MRYIGIQCCPSAQSATLFTHSSLLATTEQLLGLPLVGSAADPSTASLRPDFHL